MSSWQKGKWCEMKNIVILVLAGLVVFLSVGMIYLNIKDISSSIEMFKNISTAGARAKAAEQADKNKKTDILIGVVLATKNDFDISILNGISTACAEINRNGGIFGRKIRLLEKHVDDTDRVTGSKNAVQELIWNKEVIAIIGGANYDQFIDIAPLCTFNGLLLISPCLTSGIVPYRKESKLVFINFPNIKQVIKVMYDFLEINKLKHVLIISSPEFQYGYYFSNAFERFSVGKTNILYRYTVYLNSDITQTIDLNLLKAFKKIDRFDSVLIGLSNEEMVQNVIGYLQKLDFLPVYMLTDDMETKKNARLKAYEKVRGYLPSTYDPDSNKLAVQKFKNMYKKEFGEFPDAWAAQGYDTVKVLAEAMKLSQSTVPSKIAVELHKIKYTETVTTAPYLEFNQAGELSSGQPIMKYIEGGEFKVLRNMKINFQTEEKNKLMLQH